MYFADDKEKTRQTKEFKTSKGRIEEGRPSAQEEEKGCVPLIIKKTRETED